MFVFICIYYFFKFAFPRSKFMISLPKLFLLYPCPWCFMVLPLSSRSRQKIKSSSSPVFPSFLTSGSCGKLNSARPCNCLYYYNVSRGPPLVLVSGVSIAQRVVPANGLDVTVLFGILRVQLFGHKPYSDRWWNYAFLFTSAGGNVHPKLSQHTE